MKWTLLLLVVACSAFARPTHVTTDDDLPWLEPEDDAGVPLGSWFDQRGFTDPREHPDEFVCEFLIKQYPWNMGDESLVLFTGRWLVCLDGAPIKSVPRDGGQP